MKEHLSGSHKNVAPCSKVPDAVRDEIKSYMNKSTTSKHLAQKQFEDRVDAGSYYGSESRNGSSSTIHNRGVRDPMDQYMTNPEEDRGQAQTMPAADRWSDIKNRSLINILVNNPYGTVFLRSIEASDEVKNATFIFNLLDGIIEEIDEQLIVQVVTDNASAYKAAGQMLKEKRTHLYWTPCAAHCIDLILEDLGDLPQHKSALSRAKKITKFIYNHSWVLSLMRKFSKKEIIRPATTRFATSYLTLQSLMEVRQPLEAIFISTEWLNSAWGKKSDGNEIRKIILNDKFWATVNYAILSTRPLVQVLRLVDAEKKPAMSFIYNAMDEAKEMIAHNLGGEEASYKEIWDIIDARWEQNGTGAFEEGVRGAAGAPAESQFEEVLLRTRYNTIAWPLTEQLKKDDFIWGKHPHQSLRACWKAITTVPVLALSNFTQTFIVETDTSVYGLGVVLRQDHRPIAYFSQVLTARARLNSVYER
ncbi:uncharacterized protein LOC110099509 [Dendrobium catenatum]|uniref:uncharacterized protein LOC110099509 n=1 Tax=Dendrobium catenatum TaxID=906689 RepID=UPI0009F55648|nr:uncharacterized protein LOC110099509 [Dendrobium catenatum]